MDKMQSGSNGKCSPPPQNQVAKAGAAAVKTTGNTASGSTGSQGAVVRKSGDKG